MKLIKRWLYFFVGLLKSSLIALYAVVRPGFGYSERYISPCIYPIDCGNYAREMIAHQPLWWAIPKIIIRVLSCNPITALLRKALSNSSRTEQLNSSVCQRGQRAHVPSSTYHSKFLRRD